MTSPSSAAALPHPLLLRQDASARETPTGRKLQKAAAEFESMLLSNLWKSMKSSFAGSDNESTDPAHQALEDLGIQAMSSAVGKSGGLGIGKLILKHLEPMLPTDANAKGLQPGKASALSADTFLKTR